MSISILLAATGVAISYAFWRLFGNFFRRGPLNNLPGPRPSSLLLGNVPELSRRDSAKQWAHLAETYGPISKLNGVLGGQGLLLYDPKALYHIFVKDQEFYRKTVAPANEFTVLIGPGLVSVEGEQHRKQRKLLNPVFSVAHLRDMTHIFYSVAHKVRNTIGGHISADGTTKVIDVNAWMSRTALEMLGQAGLGYSFDDLVQDPLDDFGEALKLFIPVSTRLVLVGYVVQQLTYLFPEWTVRSILRMTPLKNVQLLMNISDTILSRSQEIINERKEILSQGGQALLQEIGERKDIMSICLRANMAAAENEKLTDAELIAQVSTFILAGMDTTSNALSRIIHLLAEHPSVQAKLRAEIVEARGGPDGDSDLSYDDLMKLPFLDAVCRETLRLYAPVMLGVRTTTKDMILPLSELIRDQDGTVIPQLFLPKGTMVFPHHQASNCNKALWGEDAYEWNPERWLGPLPAAVENAHLPGVFSNLMTFAGGSRACIGFKFSQLEMKVILSVLLSAFSFELTDRPIFWNFSVVAYPTMGESEGSKPEMMLKVKAL